MSDEPVRILLVDDSEIYLAVMTKAIQASDKAVLAGVALNGLEGVAQVKALRPDVVSMDVHMPVMDGLDAIEQIMAEHPTPIAVITAADSSEMAGISFRAIAGGALDVLPKPASPREAQALVHRLCLFSRVRTRSRARRPIQARSTALRPAAPQTGKSWRDPGALRPVDLIAIAISTGGPPVLETVLRSLPADFGAGLAIVQHVSPGFDAHLVEWLSNSSGIPVRLAEPNGRIEKGVAWIAPANQHLLVKMGGRLLIDGEGERVAGHRPSGTVLLESVARAYGNRAAGLVLTGMGHDGADGLLTLHQAGGVTAAQDAASSAVDGMPKSARKLDAADHVVSLADLPEFVRALGGAR